MSVGLTKSVRASIRASNGTKCGRRVPRQERTGVERWAFLAADEPGEYACPDDPFGQVEPGAIS